jgi:PadR family transcriptional regulator PadR
MSRPKGSNPDFLNGVPELVLLQLLARQPMYGYELVQAIRHTTGQRLDFGEGCVYPVLHRLERAGLLASRREQAGGRNRIVYRLTAKGERRLDESAALWRRVAAAVQLVLQGGGDARPSLA